MSAHLCPGKHSPTQKATLGLCIRCRRLDASGELEPAVRLESGVAVCEAWVPLVVRLK